MNVRRFAELPQLAGNTVVAVASFALRDGTGGAVSTHTMAEVDFATNPQLTHLAVNDTTVLSEEAKKLPTLTGFGHVVRKSERRRASRRAAMQHQQKPSLLRRNSRQFGHNILRTTPCNRQLAWQFAA